MNLWLAPTGTGPGEIIDYPHLEPQLVIDSVQDADLDCHVEVENIGNRKVENLRTAMHTQEMYSAEASLPLLPTLPPHGHLSLPCSQILV